MISSEKGVLVESIKAFRVRAKRLRRTAIFMIFLIVLVLSAGIAIFVFAGQLVDSEAYQAFLEEKRNRIASVKHDIDRINLDIEEQIKQSDEYHFRLRKETEGSQGTSTPGEGAAYMELIKQVNYWETRLGLSRDRRKELEKQLQVLQSELDLAEQEGSTSTLRQDQIWRAISAIATRFGSVIILLFLVKILVPLYRYNMKLAYYYDARADALELFDTESGYDRDIPTFERLVYTLSPSDIDFGASPKSPSEEAVELAKQIIASRVGK